MSLLLPSFYRCPSEAQRGRTISSRSPELAAAAFLSPMIPTSDCCVTSCISLAATLGLFLLPSCPPSLSVSPNGSSLPSHLLKCPSPGAPAHSSHTSRPLSPGVSFSHYLFADRILASLLPGPSLELLTPDTLLGHPLGTQNGITDPTFDAEFPKRMFQNLGGIPSLLFLCTSSPSNSRAKSLSFQSTSYIISRPQCKVKMGPPCPKIKEEELLKL